MWIPEMPGWLVRRYTGGKAHNPKEIDQFCNERAKLLHSLVREAIQNSLDARLGREPVRVRFAIRVLPQEESERIRDMFVATPVEGGGGDGNAFPFLSHLRSGGVDDLPWSRDHSCTLLVVEDFGTRGLEGPFDRPPDQTNEPSDFFNFLHALGVTSKRGRSRGRHGLGKLVFPASSACRTFFAVTRRHSDGKLLMMGLAELRYRQMYGRDGPIGYEPGAWYGERNGSGFELPVEDPSEITKFVELAGLRRGDESGLSVVVPWIEEGWNHEEIIRAAIANYYFSIIMGNLKLEIGDETIDASNVQNHAERYCTDELPRYLFEFLEEALKKPDTVALPASVFDTEDADPPELVSLQEPFEKGELVAVRVPVEARRRDGTRVEGVLKAFLKRPADLPEGRALVVRDDLLLPEEARQFGQRRALALLIAQGDGIAELLGDAENPAHRGWNASSEHVRERWQNPQRVIRIARRVLPRLYELLSNEDVEDEAVLAAFFPVPAATGGAGAEKQEDTAGKTEPPATPPPPPSIPFGVRSVLQGDRAGFSLRTRKGPEGRFSVRIWLLDVDRRRNFAETDFDLRDDRRFSVETTGCRITARMSHELDFEVENPGDPMSLTVLGFDPHRDIRVEVVAAGSGE